MPDLELDHERRGTVQVRAHQPSKRRSRHKMPRVCGAVEIMSRSRVAILSQPTSTRRLLPSLERVVIWGDVVRCGGWTTCCCATAVRGSGGWGS
jgi:hypothetical protein